MNARIIVRLLLDQHGDATGDLSRRQLADLAKVNPGQLSNWIREGGSLGSDKQGRIADILLGRILDALGDNKPTPALEECITVLTNFTPRIHLQMMNPDAAWKGELIAHDSPVYIPRHTEEIVADEIRHVGAQLAIIGGPKTGKSSLLLKLWNTYSTSFSNIYVDFRHFVGTSAADICSWIQEQCESQIDSEVVGPTVLRNPNGFEAWIQNNILPRSINRRCLLLFDHPEVLQHDALELFDWLLHEYSVSEVLRSCGIILAYDPAHQHLHQFKWGFADRFRWVPLTTLSEHQTQTLARRAYDAIVDGREVHKKTGGCGFLTQAYLAQQHGKAPLETEEQAWQIMTARMKTDWGTEFRQAVVNALRNGEDALVETDHRWQFEALTTIGLFRYYTPSGDMKLPVRPVSEYIRQQLLTKLL